MTVPIFIIFCFRFSSVAGYNVNKLKGVSFFDLIHAADIGPVMKAFKNCKLYIKGGHKMNIDKQNIRIVNASWPKKYFIPNNW